MASAFYEQNETKRRKAIMTGRGRARVWISEFRQIRGDRDRKYWIRKGRVRDDSLQMLKGHRRWHRSRRPFRLRLSETPSSDRGRQQDSCLPSTLSCRLGIIRSEIAWIFRTGSMPRNRII